MTSNARENESEQMSDEKVSKNWSERNSVSIPIGAVVKPNLNSESNWTTFITETRQLSNEPFSNFNYWF